MKTLRLFSIATLCFSSLLLLTNCSSDDSADIELEDQIDLNDGNAILDAINVANATVVQGAPPAPSTDPAAPTLEAENETMLTSQGGNPEYAIDVSGGDVAGVYLQIPGADSYFDIPASAFSGGRVESGHLQTFSIELPDNIAPGIFCVDYCVYDAEQRVSNIVTVCVEIKEFGGENSDFLIGAWQVKSITRTDERGTETIVIGSDGFEDTYYTSFPCDDGSFQEFEVTETEFFDFIKLTFSEGGTLRFESSLAERYLDYENSSCETLVYKDESFIEDVDGAWSYEDARKRLIMVIAFDDEEGGEEALDLSIMVDGNTISATHEIEGSSETIVLEKQ